MIIVRCANVRYFCRMTSLSKNRLLVICCTDIEAPQWRWIDAHLPEIEFRFVRASKRLRFKSIKFSSPLAALRCVRTAQKSNADAIVAFDPSLIAWCAIFSRLLFSNIPIQGFAFNFTRLPGRLKRYIFKYALARVRTLVVSSTMEKPLYQKFFSLVPDQLCYQLWSINPPERTSLPLCPGDYVSSIGGNGRDYKTLIQAAHRLPEIQFCIVVRPNSLSGLTIPRNVQVFTNIPYDDAMNVMGQSRLTVIPLENSDTPCGHVTLVAAMFLAIPPVITDSAGISDHVQNEATGLAVAPNSEADLARAISRLHVDADLRSKIAASALALVESNCTESLVAQRFSDWIKAMKVTR